MDHGHAKAFADLLLRERKAQSVAVPEPNATQARSQLKNERGKPFLASASSESDHPVTHTTVVISELEQQADRNVGIGPKELSCFLDRHRIQRDGRQRLDAVEVLT